jgi:hypothetical protein
MIACTLTLLVGILVTVLFFGKLKRGYKKASNLKQINSQFCKRSKIFISEKERELH